MKKKSKFLIMICTLIVICTDNAYSQRHYAGVSALEASYGNNIFGRSNTHLNLSISKYRNRTTYWKIGGNFFEKSHTIKIKDTDYMCSTARDYYLDGSYFKTVATNLTSLYFSLGGGVIIGAEERKRYLSELETKYDFIFGPKVEAELEFFIAPRIAIIGRATQYWNPFSKVSKWNTTWDVGIKCLLY